MGIAQLLLRYGVAADEATANRQAATKSLSVMTAALVEHNLEALRFLGWDTQQTAPASVQHAGPKLVSRTAFCRAHGYALLTTAVCCTAASQRCIAALLLGPQVESATAQYPEIFNLALTALHGRSKR